MTTNVFRITIGASLHLPAPAGADRHLAAVPQFDGHFRFQGHTRHFTEAGSPPILTQSRHQGVASSDHPRRLDRAAKAER
jgi:hypothetical protein